ncbi:MAG: FAD-dependent oxidoreductase [Candidatus Aenigmatarchaeota archaeon]
MQVMLITKHVEEKKEIEKEVDVIIIGGGAAGYSAALYSARYGLKTLVITKDVGGMMNEASIVEDYPAIYSIKGSELGLRFKEHAEMFGAKTLIDEVVDIKNENGNFVVKTLGNYEIRSKVIIFATGSKRRKLGVPGENLNGVSYCAECDALFFKDKVVGVVGGGNSAFHDALVLAQHAKKVYIIHRRDEFRAEAVLVNSAKQNPKIEILTNKIVKEIRGNKKVEEVVLEDVKTGNTLTLKLDGLFVAIGLDPNSELAKKIGVQINERGEIIVDEGMRTNIKGVLAAGDVTNACAGFKQIVTAAAQGSIAAYNAFKYIKYGIWE